MAITLDPRSYNRIGVLRCITSRTGDLLINHTDRSKLYLIKGKNLEHFEITKPLIIKNEDKIIKSLTKKDWDFIGLEDPDIWIDENTGLMHLYFTIPIKPNLKGERIKIHLGHAEGKDLSSLVMTKPILLANDKYSAKEVSIAPLNKKGFRYNLVESRDYKKGLSYSTIQVAIAHDMGKPWTYGKIAFHPAKHNMKWIERDASPGPLLPKSFIDIGEGKLVGIINGREGNKTIAKKIKRGTFSVGIFIYDYEKGKIDWVSKKPFIQDSEAEIITFASQFVETGKGKGILYAHVDDSFVRAYTLEAEKLRKLLPKDFVFLNPGKLIDNDLELVLVKMVPANEEKGYVPAYFFEMKNTDNGEKMGRIDLRVGNNKSIYYGGNIGYTVEEKFRGHHYAGRSLKLLFPFMKKHKVNSLLITCNPENIASRKTCEFTGGKLLEIVDLPESNDQYKNGERKKCIYKFDL
jgi:predicted acetyltransferase